MIKDCGLWIGTNDHNMSLAVNNVLFFFQQKVPTSTDEVLLGILDSFYAFEELSEAVIRLDGHLKELNSDFTEKLINRSGSIKEQTTAKDLLGFMRLADADGLSTPRYVAKDWDRLPFSQFMGLQSENAAPNAEIHELKSAFEAQNRHVGCIENTLSEIKILLVGSGCEQNSDLYHLCDKIGI